MNVCTKCHCSPSNSCWDVSVWSKVYFKRLLCHFRRQSCTNRLCFIFFFKETKPSTWKKECDLLGEVRWSERKELWFGGVTQKGECLQQVDLYTCELEVRWAWCCVQKEGLGNWKHTRRERGPVSDPDSGCNGPWDVLVWMTSINFIPNVP